MNEMNAKEELISKTSFPLNYLDKKSFIFKDFGSELPLPTIKHQEWNQGLKDKIKTTKNKIVNTLVSFFIGIG